jgi:hypothetical protein
VREWFFAQPHHVDGKPICRLERISIRARDDITASDIDLAIQRDGDGLTPFGALKIPDVTLNM